MAISANTVWRVRSGATAGDANGGGFVTGASGTDFSQQDAAQYSLTSVTTAAADAILLHASAAANMVGNIAHITGGTNFTTGWYEILSVSVGVSITLDRTCTSAAGAAGTVEIGGALLTPTQAALNVVDGNTVYILGSGASYTKTSTVTWAVNSTGINGGIKVIGEGSSRPILTSATNSVAIFTGNNADNYTFRYLNITHTAATRGIGITNTGSNSTNVLIDDCIIDGCLQAVKCTSSNSLQSVRISNSELKNCTDATNGAVYMNSSGPVTIVDSYIHDNAGPGVYTDATASITCRRVRFDTNPYHIRTTGAAATQTVILDSCDLYGATTDAVELATTSGQVILTLANNIIYGNTGEGIDFNEAESFFIFQNDWNAFGANGPPNYSGIAAGTNEVTLTGDPFTNAAGGDFSLNNTAGAGAACRNVATSGLDLGALQHAEAGGGGAVNPLSGLLV